ncbi:MAG: AMP-binding protein, partial [Thermoleophilia bacterium]|nr:AMP-binding protein [Thermoleophilia bacterium]
MRTLPTECTVIAPDPLAHAIATAHPTARTVPARDILRARAIGTRVAELAVVASRLRAECPWDRVQTAATIVPHTVEEAFEVAEAVADGDPAHQADEIGDLLFQSLFLAALLEEDGNDDLATVAEVVWLDDVRKTIGLPDKLYGLMAGMMPRQFRVKTDPSSPGVVLFTSGSFGAPKGVVLSQWNLVANCRQVAQHIDLKPEWVMFNPLPTFHCFGLTGGVLLPILHGMKAFQYPSPLHAKQIVELLPEVKASILFATDTFLNQYARVASPDDFDTLEFVVAGAERVRPETHHLFNTRFHGLKLLEGYGATEAAPIVAINHPDANRPGTVGQMIPG